MQISLKLTQDQTAKLAALKDAPARLLAPLARAWESGAKEVLGRAVNGRFMGKGPFPVSQHRLGIVSHRLRQSMVTTGLQVNAGTGTASVSMGSNVKYYRGHEFGYKGTVQVRGHTRKAVVTAKNNRGKLTRKSINDLKVSKLVRGRRFGYSTVRPHGRKVNVPARRPLGTELAAVTTRATFYSKFKAVMLRVIGGGK